MPNGTLTQPNVTTYYVDADWLQQLLLMAVNMTVPSTTTIEISKKTGCVSLNRIVDGDLTTLNASLLSKQLNLNVFVINTFHEAENNEAYNGLFEWLSGREPDSINYCTKDIQLRTIPHDAQVANVTQQNDETTGELPSPYAQKIQTLLGILFCCILAVCLLIALLLRIRSCIVRRLASIRSHRLYKESAIRVHFPYDVGDTEPYVKPPVPSVTFGSNVYPVDTRIRNGHVPSTSRYGRRGSSGLYDLNYLERRRMTALMHIGATPQQEHALVHFDQNNGLRNGYVRTASGKRHAHFATTSRKTRSNATEPAILTVHRSDSV